LEIPVPLLMLYSAEEEDLRGVHTKEAAQLADAFADLLKAGS
jgi:hypothetical protein